MQIYRYLVFLPVMWGKGFDCIANVEESLEIFSHEFINYSNEHYIYIVVAS